MQVDFISSDKDSLLARCFRKALYFHIVFNIVIILSSAILVGIFVKMNLPYILEPESSPGYNEGAAFGDGGSVFRFWGICIPTYALKWLTIYDGAVLFFTLLVLKKRIAACIFAFLPALMVINLMSHIYSAAVHVCSPLILIIAGCIFFIHFLKKKSSAAATALLFSLADFFFCAIVEFDVILFLD